MTMLDEFKKQIQEYKSAGYPAIVVCTYEEVRLKEVIKETFRKKLSVYSWDMINGIVDEYDEIIVDDVKDPIDAILYLNNLKDFSIFIFHDFHKFLNSVEFIRAFKIGYLTAKEKGITLVFPVPEIKIPADIERDLVIMDFPLPDEKQIYSLAKDIIKENSLDIEIHEKDIATAKGLTINEVENAIALSIIKSKKVDKRILENQKLQAIRKNGLIEIYKPVNPDEIGGLNNLKKYISNRKKGFEDKNLPTPRGIILTGVPGTGKSLSAKATASILEIPLVKLDFSSLKSSYVGESERRLKDALKIIDSISPVVVWIDEIEKALGGVASSNKTDGGTTSAMFGIFLTWMQESKFPKYIVATSNDIEDLMTISQGALIRRFDDIFFVDLPSLEERREILSIMNKKYKCNIPLNVADMLENFTGAEIEKVVISSLYDGLDEAIKSIKPIYLQNKDVIEKFRKWAKVYAKPANKVKTSNQSKARKINLN